jgi:hypothetical protein
LSVSQRDLGRCQQFLFACNLLFKEEAALGRFGQRYGCVPIRQLLYISVGKLRGALWVAIIYLNVYQRVFSRFDTGSAS